MIRWMLLSFPLFTSLLLWFCWNSTTILFFQTRSRGCGWDVIILGCSPCFCYPYLSQFWQITRTILRIECWNLSEHTIYIGIAVSYLTSLKGLYYNMYMNSAWIRLFFTGLLRQHRTKPAWRLCTESACIFSVILHRNSLTYDSMPAGFLYNLTKNLTAHLQHKLCAVLP